MSTTEGNYQIYPKNEWIFGWEQEFTQPSKPKLAFEELLEQSRIDKRITLRMPPSLHNYLAYAASPLNTSVNQLIIEILNGWQQVRLREQVYHLKLYVRNEIGAYIRCLESLATGSTSADLDHHRRLVKEGYLHYDAACRSAGIQVDPDVLTSVPASLMP